MSKRFCILCVGLSMFSFFALKSLNATESDFEKKPLENLKLKHNLSLPPFYDKYLLRVGDLHRRTLSNLITFVSYKFNVHQGRKDDSDEELLVNAKCMNAFLTLNELFHLKINDQYKREATSQEIEKIYENTDTVLRIKACEGDFSFDITEDLKKEGYALVNDSSTKLK